MPYYTSYMWNLKNKTNKSKGEQDSRKVVRGKVAGKRQNRGRAEV